MKSFPAPVLLLAALVGTFAAIASATEPPHTYPRLALYGSIRGNGFPYIDTTGAPINTVDGPIMQDAIDKTARFDEVILDVNPIWPYRPDVITALRQANPNIKVLAYVVGHGIWNAYHFDSLNHYPTRYRRIIQNNDGRLYNRFGNYYWGSNVNLAKRDAFAEPIIADSLSWLWNEVTVTPGIWDGIFFDILCDGMAWSQYPAESIDVVRAGYPDSPSFEVGWKAASDSIAARMRRYGGDDFIMVGNCAVGTKYSTYNGWMRENFPYQAGGDWYSNMFWEPGGYITDERNFRQPRHNYIFSAHLGSSPYDPNSTRRVRFGLGSATMGDGFHVFGPQERDAFIETYHDWWYDEYAVDLSTGMSSEDTQYKGWLGQPLSDFYQMIWLQDEVPDYIPNPGFESSVTSGWNFWNTIGGTLTRDANTSMVGVSSAKIHIPISDPTDWHINYNSTQQFLANPWTSYSATFWAKASSPRIVPVLLGRPTGGSYVSRTVALTTEWKRYQVAFPMKQNTGLTNLQFYLARDAGDVWLDDVHIQQGSSVAYRRDFQNGIVLVNPSPDQSLNIQLERPFKRILGNRDPLINNGAVSNVQYLGAYDGLFLIGDDVVSPNRVEDLRKATSP